MAYTADPPVVCFVSGYRRTEHPSKDTLGNIVATKEFVVNIVSEEFAEKMNLTPAEVAPEVDEFELSGLTPVASELVRPLRVAEAMRIWRVACASFCRLETLRAGEQ